MSDTRSMWGPGGHQPGLQHPGSRLAGGLPAQPHHPWAQAPATWQATPQAQQGRTTSGQPAPKSPCLQEIGQGPGREVGPKG